MVIDSIRPSVSRRVFFHADQITPRYAVGRTRSDCDTNVLAMSRDPAIPWVRDIDGIDGIFAISVIKRRY